MKKTLQGREWLSESEKQQDCTPDPWALSCINVLRQHELVFNVDCVDASFIKIGIETPSSCLILSL